MRNKEVARVKSGQRTGGKQSGGKQKRKSASALANAAGIRAVKAIAAKRRGTAETEEDVDELEPGEAEQDEEEEEDDGEESGEIDEHESQEAETQMEPHRKKRTRSKVLIVALPLHPRVCPDVIRESARSARQILKWVVSGIF